MLNIPINNIRNFENIETIDEVTDRLDNSLKGNDLLEDFDEKELKFQQK
ncbi:MAG: hypothetical protein ACFFC3_14505 [Candidatus Odinarchaeota archaeon]